MKHLEILTIITSLVVSVGSAHALDKIPPYCNPPLKPLVASETPFTEYETDTQQAFYNYFDDFKGYLSCLEHSRAFVFSQAKEVTGTYRALFGNSDNSIVSNTTASGS